MIAHIGLFVDDLERSKAFYEKYFNAVSGDRYENDEGFSSYFVSFPDGGTRLELMHEADKSFFFDGHIAIALPSVADVDSLTSRLKDDGYPILSNPRTTGDGYYESVCADPDGYRVEITC